MNNAEQKRISAYSNADEHTRDMYASTEIGFALEGLFKKHALPENLFRTGMDIIGDAILGLMQKENVKQECITQLHTTDMIANEIASTMLKMITSSPESSQSIPEADKNMKEKLELRPQESNRQANPKEGGVGGKSPLTRADVLRSISPSRTMARDIASISEKGAPQTTIETPAPTPPLSTPNGLK